MSKLRTMAENEIVKRHAFFVDWFKGLAPDSAMEECAAAFAPDMRIIWPDASEHDRLPLIELLRSAKGTSPQDFAIQTEMHHTVDLGPELVLVTFDEHQVSNGERNARRATALFEREPSAPEGVRWRYLHQTWMAVTPIDPDNTGEEG